MAEPPQKRRTLAYALQGRPVSLLGLTGTYAGSRYDGNDDTNREFEKLPSYTVVDGKLTYRYKDLKVFGGVNNIFDEIYSTISFSETYYPMPPRNYYIGLALKF